MPDHNTDNFLGTGFKFPVQVDPNTGKVLTASNEEDISESIRIILSTQPGERPMLPHFGCSINSFVFDTPDYTTFSMMRREVENALIMWEPRIKDINVEVTQSQRDSGMLIIKINYVVRSTNNPYNLVYPFYISEGYRKSAEV